MKESVTLPPADPGRRSTRRSFAASAVHATGVCGAAALAPAVTAEKARSGPVCTSTQSTACWKLTSKLVVPEYVKGGWLLDGFPRTGEQAKSLQQANINPDKVILLDVPDAALIERVTGRRTDPVTGTMLDAAIASAASFMFQLQPSF